MKKTILKLECDYCGKELTHSIHNNNGENYPFREGWHIIKSLSMEVPRNSVHSVVNQPGGFVMENMDFCSKKCMLKSIGERYKEAREVDGDAIPDLDKQNKHNLRERQRQSRQEDEVFQNFETDEKKEGFYQKRDLRRRNRKSEPPRYSDTEYEDVKKPKKHKKKKKGFFSKFKK